MQPRTRTCVGMTLTGTLLLSGIPVVAQGVGTSPVEIPTDANLVVDVGGISTTKQAVSEAGDVNGDGIDDVIVGAGYADPNGNHSGAAYVVYGRAGGPATPTNAPTDLVPSSNGFRIDGAAAGDNLGAAVAGAGDVNGDGRDDLVIGVPDANSNGTDSGSVYVIYGQPNNAADNIDLLNDTLDPQSTGYVATGPAAFAATGQSVASTGDVNGDGRDDIIIGAPYADPSGPDSGTSYVVYGRPNNLAANLNLANALDPATSGFTIIGAVSDQSGSSVSGGGDVNGDGRADVVVGSPKADANGYDSGISYVIYGRTSQTATNVDLANPLDPATAGFQIKGANADDLSGSSVSNAGDVNGDGRDDVIIGAEFADVNGNASGASYVIYGKTNEMAANIDLGTAELDPATTGLQVSGAGAEDQSGYSVSGAGDVNGDGRDDITVGSPFAHPNGANNAGSAYVIYGQHNSAAANIDLATMTLDPASSGFLINGSAEDQWVGSSIAGSGDINDDGVDDVAVSQPGGAAASFLYGTRESSPKLSQSQYPVNVRLPRRGSRVANTVTATTRQGLPLSARIVSQAARGDVRCARIIKGPKRRLVIRTTGQCRFVRVTVRYTAPGNATYKPYAKILRFRTR